MFPYESTSWEVDYEAEKTEIREAQAARLLAIAGGTEPKTWPISGAGGTEWPFEAWFHEEGVRA